MKRTSNIPIGDTVNRKLLEIARKMGGGQLKVGFLEGATYPDGGLPVAAVAYWNEFGTSTAPARPFFRTMVAQESPRWPEMMATLAQQYEYDGTRVLKTMGQVISEELQESIVNTNAPSLSPVTLLLRSRFWTNPQDITGSDVGQAKRDIAAGATPDVTGTQAKPLVWTHTMLDSVDSEVVRK